MDSIFKKLSICILLSLFVFGTANSETETSGDTDTALPLHELRVFTEIFAKIKNDYVEQIGDKQLLEDAVRGMLAGLDPHSTYLDEEEYKNMQESASGQFGGLGIEITMENGFVKVIAPIDDTPAQRAGIKSGDLIIKLDDSSVKGMSLNDAIDIMRGEPNVPITLTIIREHEKVPLIITVIRDIIEIKSVKFDTLEAGFGYLRVANFQTQTPQYLRQAVAKLKENNNDQLKGIVLDLRDNPGGILSAAVGVADVFLNSGLIVYTEGRIANSKARFHATPSTALPDVPVVVLVNSGSASASEIVAGALKDHGRAVIMGEKTFGKGSVQTIFPMSDKVALKLTTARYYTPNGRSIQVSGIRPDIIIDKVKISGAEDLPDPSIKEKDLVGHLGNVQQQAKDEEINGSSSEEEENLALKDYELYEALNVLKGIAITNR